MAGRLTDKVALVVGAGSVAPGWGNGKACAVLYAREGARVLAVDINLDAAEETVAIIAGEGGSARAHQGDATDPAAVQAMIAACLETYGRIDILHNNVGGSIPGGPVDIAPDDWDANLAYNLKTAYLACKYAIPVMERQGGGAIVNVSSIAGMRYVDRPLASYQAAKAGLVQFSRALGVQYAKQRVRCNCVVPGLMNTPLVTHRLVDKTDPARAAEVIARRDALVPMGHMGDAWDVAYAALYLASDEARYVTATEIVVDGGLTAQCG
ncbi:MAG TPA: SDR family NAD(P)-dependent oxidoreductase [Alphaproteobacteria bacterium]